MQQSGNSRNEQVKADAHRVPAESIHRYKYKDNMPFYATDCMCYSSLFGHHIKSNHTDQPVSVFTEDNKNSCRFFFFPSAQISARVFFSWIKNIQGNSKCFSE